MKDSNIRAEIKRKLITANEKSILVDKDYFDCVNIKGSVSNQGCTANDPLCNCPCAVGGTGGFATAVPLFREPKTTEMLWAKEQVAPCSSYTGYLTISPDALLSSCGAHCHQKNFHNLFKAIRTYSTFWDTGKKTPLYRNALYELIKLEQAEMVIPGNLAVKLGDFIFIPNDGSALGREYSGGWLVAQIEHNVIGTQNYTMTLSLIRDGRINTPEEEG